MAVDAIVIVLATILAYELRGQLAAITSLKPFKNELPVALAVLPLWLAIFYAFGCYRPQYLNTGGDAFRRFTGAAIGGAFALGFVSFALNLQLSRIFVATLFVLVFVFGGGMRLLVREYLKQARAKGHLVQNVLIVGADSEAAEVAEAMVRSSWVGYRVVGFLDQERLIGSEVVEGVEVVGRIESVLDQALERRAGLVLVSPTAVPAGTLKDVIVTLEGSPIDVAIAPSLFEVVTRRVTVESVGNVPILHVSQIRLTGIRAATKRVVDIVGSLALMAVFWPVMLGAAIAIWSEDGKPAIFRQRRVGKDGAEFTLRKFRTMHPDAKERLRDVENLNEAGQHFFKIRRDPRVTRVGRFLRKWSIDEMPQFWNVFKGEMSLIGPRPPLPEEVDDYDAWQMRRLRVRPGLSGYWQVSGRSNVPFDEAVRLDLFYIANWSLGFDLYLMARTVKAVIGRVGAY